MSDFRGGTDSPHKLFPMVFCFLLLVPQSSFGAPLPMIMESASHLAQLGELANGGVKTATIGADAARAGTAAFDAAKIADMGTKAETIKAGATGAQTLSEMRGVGSAAHGLEDAGHLKDAAAGHALAEGGEAAKTGEAAKVGEGALDEAKIGEGALNEAKTGEGALDGVKVGEEALDGAKTGDSAADGAKTLEYLAAGHKAARAKFVEGFKNLKGMKLKDIAQSAKVKVFGEENKVMTNLVGKDVTDVQKAEEIWNGMSDAEKLEKTTDAVRAIETGKSTTNELELAKMSTWLDKAEKTKYFKTIAHGDARFDTLSKDLLGVVKADKAARAKGLFTTAFRILKSPFSKIKSVSKNLVGKMFLHFMYHIHPTFIAPEIRAAMAAKKAEITWLGWFARLIGGNAKAWTPALQTAREAGGFAVSPAGKALARVKGYLGSAKTAKEGAAAADGAANVAKGADAAEASLIAKKTEDAASAGLGTAGTASHVAEGSGGVGKHTAQQAEGVSG